jgi:protein-disulfide isomerase
MNRITGVMRRPALAASLVMALAGLGPIACKGGAVSVPPTEASQAGAQDAASLPSFVVEGDASYSAGPERFHVTLGDAPTRGPQDAEITIVMFSDFECPFCLQGYRTMLELERKYSGKVRIAYKAYPLAFHPHALLAAMAAHTAQAQGKFWEFHNLLFSGERELDVDAVFAYARRVGLDKRSLMADLEKLEYGPEVRADMRQARRLGVSSTPTFFINGRQISGAKPYEDFDVVVQDELRRVAEWRKEGVAARDIYAHAIEDGFRKVEYSRRRGLDPDSVHMVPIGGSPTRGPDTALITIVSFGDFECPFCAKGFETMQELEKAYPGKIRMVYKHNPLPFHSHAWIASRASMAAKAQGKFWEYHDALYETGADFDEDTLLQIAKRIGLDRKKFLADMNSTALDSQIERDKGLGTALGVTGTPAYFVNGRPVEGALPLLEFRMLVEEELERAQAALDKGVAPEKLYETLSQTPIE